METGKAFLGRGFRFPLAVDPMTGELAMAEGEEDIRESVLLIIRTHYGERVMRPGWGSGAADYVFDVNDNSMRQKITHDLTRDLTLCEPRIHSVSVTSKPDIPNGRLDISVAYTVRATNNRYNLVFPFYITEGRQS